MSRIFTRPMLGIGLIGVVLLVGCGGGKQPNSATELLQLSPTTLDVEGEAELRAVKATELLIPGAQFAWRRLIWMLPEGSRVKQGDVVARYAAKQSELELGQALIDLQRTALARAAKSAELGDLQGKLQVDLSQVSGLLQIARRYAGANELALSRNDILDAVQDESFLSAKQKTLQWREGMVAQRGTAELDFLDAQRSSNESTVKRSRADLAGLELRAPHDGLLILNSAWNGEKPLIGAVAWGGTSFASLPDLESMEVEISLPQVEAQGVRVGMAVQIAPVGHPDEAVRTQLSWIAAAPAPRSGDVPIKYLAMKAPVPSSAVQRYGWSPGQRFVARILLFEARAALTVPNFAVQSVGDATQVVVREQGKDHVRSVRLGVRGPSRSEVLEGLKPGERIVLALARDGGTR